MMKKWRNRYIFLLLFVIVVVLLSKGGHTVLAESSNVMEKDGLIVNVSPAFNKERYVNGYYISNVNVYASEDIVSISMRVKNMLGQKRETTTFDMVFLDKYGRELERVQGFIGEVEASKSMPIGITISGGVFNIDAYDFTMEFSDEDIVEVSPLPSPSISPSPSLSPTSSVDEDLKGDRLIKMVEGLSVRQTDNCNVKLSWDMGNAENIIVLRAKEKDMEYELISYMSGKKKEFVDETAVRGKTYFYKVISYNGDLTEEVLSFDAAAKRVTLDYLIQPIISVTKGKSLGQKYVQITLKRYEGKYVEIYMKDFGKYKKLNINQGKNLCRYKKYRFRYAKGGASLFFKVRTYQMVAEKKRYSKFSQIGKIRI